MQDKVSVILTTYNREEMILRAVKSVLNQTYKNIEIIIVDDCSKDNTVKKIKEYIDKDNIKNIILLVNEKNMGANYSRNRGIKQATGKYISFLDDDDEYYPNKIEKQIKLMKKYKDKAIIYCGMEIYEEDNLIAKTKLKHKGYILNKIIEDNFIGNPSLLLLREILIEYNFDNSFPSCQDWELVTRLSEKFEFYYTKDLLVKVNKHSGESIGAGPKALQGFQMYYKKHINKYNLLKIIKIVLLYFLRGVKNKQHFQFKKIYFLLKAYFEK